MILTGKFTGDGDATIRISGKVAGRTRQIEIPVGRDARRPRTPPFPPSGRG